MGAAFWEVSFTKILGYQNSEFMEILYFYMLRPTRQTLCLQNGGF